MFDPVHNGHLRAALEVLDALALHELRLIPCGRPFHRPPPVASAADRIAMLELAVKGESRFVVDDRECRRGGVSYMVDTLQSLGEELHPCRQFLLIGSDAFNSLNGWDRWRQLFDHAHLIILARPGWQIEAETTLRDIFTQRRVSSASLLKTADAGNILVFEPTPLMISSSRIRETVADGKSIRYLVPGEVDTYIKQNRLYDRNQ